ncbi:MAG: hypothetical protein IJP82_02065 [Bacteroidaceae bacterium]|nr:hypothetical protein [Bacteroidaceae bacterium]
MAKDYFKSDEFLEILTAYEDARDGGQNIYLDADDFADIADYYLSQDAPYMAHEAVDIGLTIHPDDDVLMVVKGAVYIYQRLFDEAEDVLDDLDPENSDVVYQRAQLQYAKYMDTAKAEEIWREWLLLDNGDRPTEEQRRDNYIHIISSLIELRDDDSLEDEHRWDLEAVRRWIREYIDQFQPLGKYDEDVQIADICRENELADLMCEVLTQVLEERPYLKKGWANLALAQYMIQKNEQALESCDFALAINPKDLETLLTKAHALNALNNHQGAKEAFKEYLDKGGDPVQIIPLAEILFLLGEKDEAISQLERLAQRFDDDKEVVETAGHGKIKKIIPKQHYALIDQGCEAFMDLYVKVFSDMGDLLHRNECFEESLQAYMKVVETDSHCAEAYFMLGINYLALEDYEKAARNFSFALKNAEDQVMMGIDIALTFVLNNFDHIAIEVLSAIEKIALYNDSPYTKNIPAAKSLTYLKLGDTKQFLENFKIACQQTPDLIGKVYEGYFPENMPISQWSDYAEKDMDKLMKNFNSEDLYLKGFS